MNYKTFPNKGTKEETKSQRENKKMPICIPKTNLILTVCTIKDHFFLDFFPFNQKIFRILIYFKIKTVKFKIPLFLRQILIEILETVFTIIYNCTFTFTCLRLTT